MSDQEPAVAPVAKKPRSTVERVIVQGGILLLLLMAVVQYLAYRNFAKTRSPLQAAVKESDDSDAVVTEEMVGKMVHGSPHYVKGEPGPSRVDTYTWNGLLKNYVLHVRYSVNPPEVVGIETE